jgi:hypothetical protein
MNDSVPGGPEYAVIISGEEVPEDVRQPAERAAGIARSKATKSVRLYYARPELEEEAIDRLRYEREHEEIFEEQARELGITVPEIAFHQLSRIPEAEGARVDLDGRQVFYRHPDVIVVRAEAAVVSAENLPDDAPDELTRLRESVAFSVAWAYREALWELVGMDALLRRNKLKSTQRETDTIMYARDVVRSNAPW